jgi:hypothetical protein
MLTNLENNLENNELDESKHWIYKSSECDCVFEISIDDHPPPKNTKQQTTSNKQTNKKINKTYFIEFCHFGKRIYFFYVLIMIAYDFWVDCSIWL